MDESLPAPVSTAPVGPMTPETWARITDLFGQIMEMAPAERHTFVASLRVEDPAAACELASLLSQHEREGDFLPDLPLPAPILPDLSGRTVGTYRLLRLLGAGGMGAVYLAERSDGAFSKQVAVKLLSAAFLQSRDRFLREREFLARLDHQNITGLIDAGATADGWPYLVMDYVEGVPIDRYCTERDLSMDERLALVQQVCAGVAHAHQNLIIHYDIKPENILVTPDGIVKLLDFGIATLLDPAGGMTLYRPATPAYCSPEQLQGDPVTTASDVYSIGVVAYVVLTGSGPHPWRSGRLDEVVQAVLSAEPLRASLVPGLAPQRARKLRGDLDNILSKAVAKDPQRRYASVLQLGDDLESYRRGFPVRARASTFLYRLKRGTARHRFAAAAGALGIVSLLAAAAISTWQARVAQRRFDDLREFAHAVVFDVNDALSPIPGTTAARKLVVETALRYLDRLNQERVSDPSLREELAGAYIRIGKVQGGAFLPNLGDSAGAVASFRKAIATTGPIGTTPALERLRIEALINIALLAADPIQGAPEFDAAIAAAERQLVADADDLRSLRLIADAYHGRATVAHLTNNVPDHEEMAGRQVVVRERIRRLSAGFWQDEASLARALAQQALALEQRVDFNGALSHLYRARSILEAAIERTPGNQMLIRGLAEVRSRTVSSMLGLGRTSEATAEVGAAVDLLEPLVASDRDNVQYKADLAYAWLRLGDARRAEGDVVSALDFHQRALAIRRERAARYGGFIFVPWELTRSLNTVVELLLSVSPARTAEAAALFAEARDVGEKALTVAPSFTQVRKQVAYATEGLGRLVLSRDGPHAAEARAFLERSAQTWREILARSSGDLKDAEGPARVQSALASLSPRL